MSFRNLTGYFGVTPSEVRRMQKEVGKDIRGTKLNSFDKKVYNYGVSKSDLKRYRKQVSVK